MENDARNELDRLTNRVQFLEQALLQCCSERDAAKEEAAAFRECYDRAQQEIEKYKAGRTFPPQ